MKARIKKGAFGKIDVEITGIEGLPGKKYIFSDIEECCCKILSTNELKEIVRQIKTQLSWRCCPEYQKQKEVIDKIEKVIRDRVDRRSVSSYPCQCCNSHRPRYIRARIERDGGIASIAVTHNGKKYIHIDTEELGCRNFSTNELEEIVRQIEVEQLGCLKAQDIPPLYWDILDKVKNVIRKRREELPSHACCCHCCSCLREMSYDRPYFASNQVRCIHQLKVGRTYHNVHRSEGKTFSDRFVLVREPYFDRESWWIEIEYEYVGEKHRTTISIADRNVVPYKDGRWNACNYLTF